MLDRPEMFPLRLLELSRLLSSEKVSPPSGLREQAWIAVQTGLGRATRAEAARQAAAWRAWAMVTDSDGRTLAKVMVRAWQLAAINGSDHE